ncbi:MAG: prephenate dehydrogenase/arogenate dehydrogenase family protein [Candidatus Zhuqueibacterota bacterium]
MQKCSQITIIGTGLIGGSIGLALNRKKFCQTIIGVDEYSIIHKALERGAISEGYNPAELAQALKGSDLIFLCTPVQQIVELLPQIAQFADENALVCDVGSTKTLIVSEANKYFGKRNFFLGTHPMAGAEKRGIESADPFLFENAIWVLTPGLLVPEAITRKVGTLFESIGAKILMLTPEMHDDIAAGVSHLPQFAAVAMVNLLGRHNQQNANFLKLAAGGFRDMTRIASSPFSVWKDICRTNRDQIVKFLEEYMNELKQVRNHLLDQDLETYFDRAATTRLAIPKDSKGFLRPLHDVSIAVEDIPGVIAKFSNLLAQNNINIKDIEVLKVREGEGGSIRLAFDTERERREAVKLIRDAGFSCYARD